MAIAPAAWARETIGVYFRNATAVRDYRVQLRGSRAVVLWAVYLTVLIGFGMITYYDAAARQRMSIVDAQASLQTFYERIMYLLATAVIMIAPALTATAIVSERQRKSLDLVFSAPVSPKYYLVGKMISSYRYVWMLLVLSLPVTAACVVLGGASWSEVLTSYALMSLQGLVYTSIALLFSTLAQRPVGAIIWSYIGVAAYVIAVSIVATMSSVGSWIGMGRQTLEMPFVVTLAPYSPFRIVASYTVLFDYHVPNWLISAMFVLLFTKIMLVGAASVLSPYGSAETKSLRIHGLVYSFLLSLGISAAMGSSLFFSAAMVRGMSGSGAPMADYEMTYARQFVSMLTGLVILLPFISCYGTDLEKKFWPDGLFRIRRTLMATPAGGLPYLISLGLAVAAGISFYAVWHPEILGVRSLGYLYYGLALLFFCWSFGRLTSAMNNGLRYARTLQFTILVLVLWLPPPFLAIADPTGFASSPRAMGITPGDFEPARIGPSLWDFYILRPLYSTDDKTLLALLFGTVLIVVGLFITRWSESLAKARYGRVGLSYERT